MFSTTSSDSLLSQTVNNSRKMTQPNQNKTNQNQPNQNYNNTTYDIHTQQAMNGGDVDSLMSNESVSLGDMFGAFSMFLHDKYGFDVDVSKDGTLSQRKVSVKSSDKDEIEADAEEDIANYRNLAEIRDLTDREIMEAVYRVTVDYGLTEQQACAFFQAFMQDESSFLREAWDVCNSKYEPEVVVESGKNFTVKCNLTNQQKEFIIDQYPELNIRFENGFKKDHDVAAVCRSIDTYIINNKTPRDARCVDIGGNCCVYMTKGVTNVHCCCPKIDAKDMERFLKRHEYARVCIRKTKEKIRSMERAKCNEKWIDKERGVVAACERFLSNEKEFLCDDLSQNCDYKSPYGMSIHAAYDIPMEDWPKIMIKHGMQVVYGSMLYNHEILSQESGRFEEMEFEYVREGDSINFYFKSMEAGYTHNFENYRKYGLSCTIEYGGYLFLYEVVKYRKYSIDFEIVMLSDNAKDVKPLVDSVIVENPHRGEIELRGIYYDGVGDPDDKSSYELTNTFIDNTAWKRLMNWCLSYGDGLTFDHVLRYIQSLSHTIIINRVVLSKGDKVTSDNLAFIATCAFFITIRMRYESEDIIRKFKNDVDKRRNALVSWKNIFTGKSLGAVFGLMYTRLIDTNVQKFREYLVRKMGEDGLPEFLYMFDYEYTSWNDVVVQDVSVPRETLAEMIQDADDDFDLYKKSNMYLPTFEENASASISDLCAEEKALLEARDILMNLGDTEGLAQLEALANAYFVSERRSSFNTSDSSDSNVEDVQESVYTEESPVFDSVTDIVNEEEVEDTTVEYIPDDASGLPCTSVRVELDKCATALKEDKYHPDYITDMHSGSELLAKMLRGENINVEEHLPISENDFEYLGDTEEISKKDAEEMCKVKREIVPVQGVPYLGYQEPEIVSEDYMYDYWKQAMREYQKMCGTQEEKVRDSVCSHIVTMLTWTRCRTSTGAYVHKPSITLETARRFGHEIEPNILTFDGNGLLERKFIDYDKEGIYNTSVAWMYGVDVTTRETVLHARKPVIDEFSKYDDEILHKPSKGTNSNDSQDGPNFIRIRKCTRTTCKRHKNMVPEGVETLCITPNVLKTRTKLYVERELSVLLGRAFASSVIRYTCPEYTPHLPCKVIMMEMYAGAGKTFFLTWAAKKGDLILTARRDAVGEIVVDLQDRGLTPDDVAVSTADSYILNSTRTYRVVHVDEATMLHAGQLFAIAQIAKCKVMVLYGDKKQISYVVRNTIYKPLYKSIPEFIPRYYSNLSWRYPADAAYLNSDIYGTPVYTTNPLLRSLNVIQMDEKAYDTVPYVEGAHYICFTNDDVSALRKHFKDRKYKTYTTEVIPQVQVFGKEKRIVDVKRNFEKITTAHVAEGGTWRDVIIVRGTKVEYSIYNQLPHLLVATTRHTRTCTYYSAFPPEKDTLWQRMSKARNAREEELKKLVVSKKLFANDTEVLVDDVKYKSSILEHPVYQEIMLNKEEKSSKI
uniref:Polyprotein n=1 Tax=Rhizopus microsporus virga-like virus 1 TaxID=3156536 RepID=A0AAT9H7J5_9VIRU